MSSQRSATSSAQRDQLAGAQPVAVGEQDSGGVPVAPSVVTGGVDQLLDLALVSLHTGMSRWEILKSTLLALLISTALAGALVLTVIGAMYAGW
jgi:hypothetical protein